MHLQLKFNIKEQKFYCKTQLKRQAEVGLKSSENKGNETKSV